MTTLIINRTKFTYMNKHILLSLAVLATTVGWAQDLKLNDLEYFERQGVNVLVYSNSFNGGFNDEKNSGIEVIHHGVRTIQGGAVRLNNTPEQWDLVPTMTSRKVDREKGTIEVGLRYDYYDFDARLWRLPYGSTSPSQRNWLAKQVSIWSSCPRNTG